MVVADAGHDEILALGGLFRRRRAFAAVLGDPLLGFAGGVPPFCAYVVSVGGLGPADGGASTGWLPD
jgi:hypothetical protein